MNGEETGAEGRGFAHIVTGRMRVQVTNSLIWENFHGKMPLPIHLQEIKP
jgi:hypothetical protein